MAITGEQRYFTTHELESQLGSRSLGRFIRECEAGLLDEIRAIAYRVAWDNEVRAIFVSGPSSSGKTTFTHRIAAALELNGRETVTVSLDDYYREQGEPTYVDGRPDFESLDSLDVELMHHQLERLLAGDEVVVLRFDFRARRVYEETRRLAIRATA